MMPNIGVQYKTKKAFLFWQKQAKKVTGLAITQDEFVTFLLSLYAEHVEKIGGSLNAIN